MFKRGDFIKIKPNTKLDTGEIVNDWAGQIERVFPKDGACMIVLDTFTIDSLEDVYIQRAMEEGVEPFMTVLDFEDIELAPRRDTEDKFMDALDRLGDRVIALDEVMETERRTLYDQWETEFNKSDFYTALSPIQKKHAYVVYSFMDMLYTFEHLEPQHWTVEAVQTVCLEIAPSTLTADEEAFEHYGDIIINFLNFLGSKNYIKNNDSLAKGVERIKDNILKEARKSENWAYSKTIMMEAKAEGVDLDNEKELEAYMLLRQEATRQEAEKKEAIKRENAAFLNKLGRNEKITVQYEDGTLVEDIKFKKVKGDLESGLCIFIKK